MGKKIAILALGSRGDVQPFVALGTALQRRGHSVAVATFGSFRGLVEGVGLRLIPVPGDAQAMTGQLMATDGLGSRNPFRLMRKIMNSFGKMLHEYSAAFGAPELLASEIIVDQLPGGIFGRDIAEKSGAAYFSAAVIPLLRTSRFPSPLLAAASLGPPLNYLTYLFSEQLLWYFFRPEIKRFRAQLGLPPPPRFFRASTAPVLLGVSPKVVPPPPDWPPHVHVTGYWWLEQAAWQPPAALQQFIEAGDPPVFIGFGSMISNDPAALTQKVMQAVRVSGVRVVIGTSWGAWPDDFASDRVFRVEYAPYAWLFPNMAAVVHHGGSGTTGSALTSGVPSMVVAFGTDQPYWGQRTADLGAGLPPLHVKSLTAEALAGSLRRLVSDPTLRTTAAALGAQLREERGPENAVAAVEAGVR
jgi:UDP:flavonoid glycosyltransferase YjiC (YdhE family)